MKKCLAVPLQSPSICVSRSPLVQPLTASTAELPDMQDGAMISFRSHPLSLASRRANAAYLPCWMKGQNCRSSVSQSQNSGPSALQYFPLAFLSTWKKDLPLCSFICTIASVKIHCSVVSLAFPVMVSRVPCPCTVLSLVIS